MLAARSPDRLVGLVLASILVETAQLVLLSEALVQGRLQAPSAPTEPGCFVWLPSGCPGVIDLENEETVLFAASVNTSAWLHDVAAERVAEPRSGARQARSARRSQRICEARAATFNTVCNVDDVAMLFVEEPPGSGSAGAAPDATTREAAHAALLGSIRLPHDEASQEHAADPDSDAQPAAEPDLAPAAAAGGAGSGAGEPAGEAAGGADGAGGAEAAVGAEAAAAEAGRRGSARPRPRPQLLPEPLHPWAAADRADDPHDDDLGVGKKDAGVDVSSATLASDDLAGSEDVLAPGPISTTAQGPASPPPATSRALPSGAPEPPEEHGCYVWTPSGCPRQPNFHGDAWKQDKFGELHNDAASGKAACFKRSSMFNAWCGVTDAVMMLVPPKRPAPPPEVGCFIWYPSGCPKQPTVKSNPNQWKHDTWAESNANARVDRGACLKRKFHLGAWCGTNDVEVLFVSEEEAKENALASELARGAADAAAFQPLSRAVDAGFATTGAPMVPAEAPDLPVEAGCYLWTPSGCTPAGLHAQFRWKRDTYGEEHAGAGLGAAACEARKASFDALCGVQDSVMRLVGPEPRGQPERPGQPGCYVWQPSGCPSKGVESSSRWKHDRWAEENVEARYDSAACFHRKAKFDAFCGTSDAEMLFVAEAQSQARVASAPASTAAMAWEEERSGYSKVYGEPDEERRPRASKVYEKDADLLSFPTGGAHASGGEHRAAPPAGAAVPRSEGEPAESGCFAWIPGGCHGNEQDASGPRKWKRDAWGEVHKGANFNRAACMARKESFDRYCGVTTTVMAWRAPKRPSEPTGPGCYVWHPSGCPRKPTVKVDTSWAHDIWGENNRGAGSSEQACGSRKAQYDSFCGTSDVEMLFVGPAGHAGQRPR